MGLKSRVLNEAKSEAKTRRERGQKIALETLQLMMISGSHLAAAQHQPDSSLAAALEWHPPGRATYEMNLLDGFARRSHD